MKRVITILIAIGLTASLFGQIAIAQSYPKQNLRYGSMYPKGYPNTKSEVYIAEQLEKRTGEAIKVKIFWGAVLGGAKELPALIGSGALDMGSFPTSYHFSRFPMDSFATLPLIYPDIPTLVKLNRKALAMSSQLRLDLEKNKLYGFNYGGLGILRLFSKKPIRTMSDLKGLKVRTFGAIYPKLFAKWGIVPVNVQYNETYEGLQRGTIDATIASDALAFVMKWTEVAKYRIDVNLGTDQLPRSYMNLDLYNAWPQHLKDTFQEIVQEAEEVGIKTMVGFNQHALDQLKKADVKMIHFEDQDKIDAYQGYVLDLAAEIVAKEGDEYVKPAREYADWIKSELNVR